MPLIKEMSEDVDRGRALEWLAFLLRGTFPKDFVIDCLSSTQFTAKYIGKEDFISIPTDPDIEVTDIDFCKRIIYYKILKSENN